MLNFMKWLPYIIILLILLPGCTDPSSLAKKYDLEWNEHYNNGDNIKALESILIAIDIDPDNSAYWRHKGLSHRYLDQRKEEFNSYKKAIELNKNDYIAYYLYAGFLGEHDQIEGAKEALRKAESLYDGKNEHIHSGIKELKAALELDYVTVEQEQI